jgi:hypothetical protein
LRKIPLLEVGRDWRDEKNGWNCVGSRAQVPERPEVNLGVEGITHPNCLPLQHQPDQLRKTKKLG